MIDPTTNELTEQFEHERTRLHALATRMLRDPHDAEDAVQRTWIKTTRTSRQDIHNLGAWLTVIVTRISLDMLRERSIRPIPSTHEASADTPAEPTGDPAREAELADNVAAALLVVLDTLSPSEQLVFVLHDVFALPLTQIATLLGRSHPATKQLASRARRKLQAATSAEIKSSGPTVQHRKVVESFLTAARNGDLTRLLELLDPAANLIADAAAVRLGAPSHLTGADQVAELFVGRAQGAQRVTIDGEHALAWIVNGRVRVVWDFVIEDNAILHINMLADHLTIPTSTPPEAR